MFRCWMKGNATTATIEHFSIHWAFHGKPEVISAICMIFLMAALSPKVFRPLGKPAVPFECAGSPLIYGTAGPKQAANVTPLLTNYSIAAMPPTFLKRFIFVIPNIAEVTRERSNGWPNKPAEWLPATGVEWNDEGD
ncbi:hypothetical protein SD70_20765 [Gordoniibacillus kamchatkensis]|uniref:Uncharacterized protein n=1 Tax=Gordoniibacillus kamchatkensis TaxID=1590651 RepID=A0ABR5AE87_9BACL|nr:hypothetical protein SD70_20765 [Paenibacillus sp. VKM B-2647]